MMKKFCSLVFATAALSAFAAADIYEIRACDADGTSITSGYSYDRPMKSGDTFYFNVRLVTRGMDTTTEKYSYAYDYIGVGSPLVDEQYSPLAIGIFVSNDADSSGNRRVDYAELVGSPRKMAASGSKAIYWDCVFKYTVKPGDFALPVSLSIMDEGVVRPVVEGSKVSNEYYFNTLRPWKVRHVTTTWNALGGSNDVSRADAVWAIGTPTWPHEDPEATRAEDYSLRGASFYVQTVKFDETIYEKPATETEAGYWRSVSMGDEQTCPVVVDATATGADRATTLYVWSDDDSAVKIKGGTKVEMISGYVSGQPKYVTNTVGKVEFAKGQAEADFTIVGVTSNKTANIVMSPWKNYSYDSTKTRLLDYKTIPVFCSEPEAPSVQLSNNPDTPKAQSSKKLSFDAPSMQTTEFVNLDSKPFYITLSQAYTSDLTIQLEVEYSADPSVDAIAENFIAIEQYGGVDGTFNPSQKAYTNVTFKAGELQKELWVYPLGGNSETKMNGIRVRPVITDAAAKKIYDTDDELVITIGQTHTPVIKEPVQGDEYRNVSGRKGDTFDVSLMISDCYRDLNLTNGFQVTMSGAVSLTTNLVFKEETPIIIPVGGYDYKKADQQSFTITVKEPEAVYGSQARKTSVQVFFTVAVEEEKTISLESWYDVSATSTEKHAGTTFVEGRRILPKFQVSGGTPDHDIYIFLEPQNAASSNLVDCVAFTTQGIPLFAGMTETALNERFALNLLDGCRDTDATAGQLQYKIVTRKGPAATDEPDDTFSPVPATLSLTVKNEYAISKKLYIAGNPTPVANGSHFAPPLSSGVSNSFVAVVSDASVLDVSNGLYVVWNFSDGYSFAPTFDLSYSFASNSSVECWHVFETESVTQQVQFVALDKDMLASLGGTSKLDNLATLWPSIVEMVGDAGVYKATVYVSQEPYITIVNEEDKYSFSVEEDASASSSKTMNKLKVILSEPAKADLTVKITATTYSDYTDPVDIGALVFNTNSLTFKKGSTTPSGAVKELKYAWGKLDGAIGSMDAGFYVKAEVVTPGLTGYYNPGEAEIYVLNKPPVISAGGQREGTTNTTVAVGEQFTIEWSASDVAIDLANGLKAEWIVDGVKVPALSVSGITDSSHQYVTTNVFTRSGLHTMQLAVYDRSGADSNGGYDGVAYRTWLYYLSPTKELVVRPVGQYDDAHAVASDSRYDAAPGLGLGRVWADASSRVVDGFYHTYSYAVDDTTAMIYAYGYAHNYDAAGNPVPYADDGTLGTSNPKRDIALDENGNNWVAPALYYYYAGRYDNFFYRWVTVGGGETGTTNTLGKVFFDLTPGMQHEEQVVLDEYDAKKNSYLTMIREAVFSRELYESDNLGDINGDGVPDAYVRAYTDMGVINTDGAVVGDDLKSLESFNDDGDFYPVSTTAVFPGLSNSWMIVGNKFTAVDEIRGFDHHLNHALPRSANYGYPTQIAKLVTVPDVKYVEPQYDATGAIVNGSTLSMCEWVAFKNWCARQTPELDPADEANWSLWTPENPTDPTLADTDEDSIPDGYEYYFWYRAHVGYDVDGNNTNFVRMTGRRYVVDRPGEPEIITADEIERKFNPNVKNADVDRLDTDNDGLSDFEEYVLGTNPFDFDTDNDGLPDGFEVICSKTDPLKYSTDGSIADGEFNPDGDVMARYEAKMNFITGWIVDKDTSVSNAITVCSFDEFQLNDDREIVNSNHCWTTWTYGVGGPLARGRSLGYGATIKGFVAAEADPVVTNVVMMHYQVYHDLGFDPRTAWKRPTHEHSVNTTFFTCSDEHLLLGFWINEGLLSPADYTPSTQMPLASIWLKYTTQCAVAADADTDLDGMPDGWELYVMAGLPLYDNNGKLIVSWGALGVDPNWTSPLNPASCGDGDADSDALEFVEEYSATESADEYSATAPTIFNRNPAWRNKKMPTDPWNDDTDGDGIPDGAEFAEPFVYGSSGAAGGGLNPLSWDTDLDGLPDPFELEFAGSYSNGVTSVSTVVSDDGATTNEVSQTGTGAWNNDGMDGTVNDAMEDYDHDGLLNWQEYMVGAMRHFRYDDTVSQWGVIANDFAMPSAADEEAWGRFWYRLIVDPVGYEDYDDTSKSSKAFNPYMSLFRYTYLEPLSLGFDPSMAYFSLCRNAWDPARGKFYMFRDGIYHDLKTPNPDMYFVIGLTGEKIQYNRFTWKSRPGFAWFVPPYGISEATGGPIYPKKYICCSPINHDTDGDGMDDYYELFHGLNPLLGATGVMLEGGDGDPIPIDVVYAAYATIDNPDVPTAENNWWYNPTAANHKEMEMSPGTKSGGYDFINFPWLAGLAHADPDGDDARNYEEALMANVQAAATYFHTDPTPMWMTDPDYVKSFTFRYYRTMEEAHNLIEGVDIDHFTYINPYSGKKETHYFSEYPCLSWVKDGAYVDIQYPGLNYWKVLPEGTQFDYEVSEGYDSDNDYLNDSEERVGLMKSASDPQDHDDPLRRQAMWFGGEEDPGFLETPLYNDEMASGDEGGSEPRENFEFFTAECWAKPDVSTYNKVGVQTVLERSINTGVAGPADSTYVRKNFIIGIRDGRWFAGFDSAGTALDRIEITDGPVATTNWTHLAATYDGIELKLYVNCGDDMRVVRKTCGRHPEHGLVSTVIDKKGELALYNEPYYAFMGSPCQAILVGASAMDILAHKFDFSTMTMWTKMEDYGCFFKGYVDEVRVWDGARTQAEIQADYRNLVRYDTALALANRQAVYEKWVEGATRVENNVNGTLPPQLKYHWSFDHLPGATDIADTIKVPTGFSSDYEVVDAKAKWVRPKEWYSPWWATVDTSLLPKAYPDLAWIPWINNTVSHLPRFDGTTVDSCYWTEQTCGNQTAAALGYKKFAFAHTHELYNNWVQMGYELPSNVKTTPTRWKNLQALGESMENRVKFTYRDSHVYGDDMLPFGSAFPKRISAAEGGMWDQQGAADAWAETGDDSNNDHLPDWWTQYALENYYEGDPTGTVTWNTIVNYFGVRMRAQEAYKRDLAKGMLSDKEYHEEYADSRDLDQDGMVDWWEDLYGIDTGSKSDALADPDCDGLSNYQEYLVSQKYGWYVLNPKLGMTHDGQLETDYFLKAPNGHYLGEVLADHDFLEDNDEKALGTDHTLYDAYSDHDEDGWTAFSEARYSAFKMGISARFVSHMNGEEEVTDAPVPVVHTTLRYNGEATGSEPIVVEAYSGNNLQKQPSATYTIQPGAKSEERYLNLGTYENRIIHGTLAPGHILAGEDQIKLQFFFVQPDDRFSWTVDTGSLDGPASYTGTYAEMIEAMATYGDTFSLSSQELGWNDLTIGNLIKYTDSAEQSLQISVDEDTQKGHLLLAGKRAGEINLKTGDFDLDLSSIGLTYIESNEIQLSQCFFRLAYTSSIPAQQTKALTLSLAKPDSGKLTEGPTAFVAYMDKDGDGAFTPDVDPIGFVKDVQIGWDNVPEIAIEMTDSSQAAGKRLAVPDDAEMIRIIRTTINGEEKLGESEVKRRIVYSRTAADVVRKNVYEADLVTGNKFGLDWTSLRGDIEAMDGVALKDVTEVGYVVVNTAGSVQNIDPETIIDEFTVSYTAEPSKGVCVSPSAKAYGIVETQRPTFVWSAPEGYTAFRLEIGDAAGNWFYDSGILVAPARNASEQYVWTAPVFIGTNVCNDVRILANNSNYLWRVAMYNAKFSKTNDAVSVWSDSAAFSTALAKTNDRTTTYSSVAVDVSYFGPAANDLADVIVELYRTADFTGTPAARSRLFDVDGTVASLTNRSRVVFHGLADGDYYAVAFIDRNANGQRDKWESWGYAAQVGLDVAAIWTPTAAAADATSARIPSVQVFIEDTDINQNDVLDLFDDEEILKTASEATATGADTTDVDSDGLSGDEETSDTYTDKGKWDTDQDGMPDGWEARFADTDPLMSDAITAATGDLMAFAVTSGVYRIVSNADGEKYLVRDTNGVYRVGDTLTADKLITTYDYVTIAADATGTNFVKTTYAGLGTNLVAGADFKIDSIAAVSVALVHAQVYDEFGYSQRTAVDANDVHTKQFTALDKYMVIRYLAAIGIRTADEESVNRGKLWKDYSLKPLDTDNDRDGVADGWELYLMFGTNGVKSASNYAKPSDTPVNPWKFADRNLDLDSDGLTLVDEYSQGNTPSDVWNEYSVYEELLAAGILPEGADKFTDAKARRFAISAETYEDDDDLDQIKNAQEMWAYYLDMDNLADIDPEKAFSDGLTPDYFRLCGSKYLGEIYNGAEFIEQKMRVDLDLSDLSRAGTRDYNHTGWDYWSVARFMQSEDASSLVYSNCVLSAGTGSLTRLVDDPDEVYALAPDDLKKLQRDGEIKLVTVERVSVTNEDQSVTDYARYGYRDLTGTTGGAPSPSCKLTLKYGGSGTNEVVVEAYQVSSAAPEMGEELSARWNVSTMFVSGLAKATLRTPTFGSLKQGKCRLVAYIDRDGDGKPSAKDVRGETEFIVGYMGVTAEIRLADPITALPVLTLGGTSNEIYQTIAIVRTKVNGRYVKPRGVTLRRYLNNVNREVVFPSEYLDEDNDFIGLDKYLSFNADEEKGDPSELELPGVETVTYEIVRMPTDYATEGDDSWRMSVTNLNHYTYVVTDEEGEPTYDDDGNEITQTVDQSVNEEFTVGYSIERDIPLEVKGEAASIVGGAILSFSIPTDRAVTKFWLDLTGPFGGVVEAERGYLLDCAANGRVVLDETWFKKNNLVLAAGEYRVRVALGNDKFASAPMGTEDEQWSALATFNVNRAASFDGKLAVRVLHPGNAALAAGKLTVAAYEKGDLAEPYKTVVGKSTNDVIVINGLRADADYYIAAWYVKDAADGRSGSTKSDATIRMPYDTWGYLTMLGESVTGFDAKAVTAKVSTSVTNLIYLQDTDFNDNNILDREETIKSIPGVTDPAAPNWLDLDCDGVIDSDDPDPVFNNSKDTLEGDVMAYATKRMFCVQIGTMDDSTNWVWYAVTDPKNETSADKLDNDEIIIPRGTAASTLTTLATTYTYGRKKSAPFGIGTNVTLTAGKVYGYAWKEIALVHNQVYREFGFNPNTACALSSVTNWVNTKKFTSLDKYIVTNYLMAVGAMAPDAVQTNWVLNAKRLDYDFDGVPDGWELYTMFGDNDYKVLAKTFDNQVINPWVAEDRDGDPDGDALTNLHEYNGGKGSTDPWNAYTIYDELAARGLILEGTPKFTDAIAKRFGITELTEDEDDDLDLITNLDELRAYYRDPAALADIAVTNAWSDGVTADYFRACGSSYLGKLFNGGEFVEPMMRTILGMSNLALAGTRDYDMSGWDNWSYARGGWISVDTNGVAIVTNVTPAIAMTVKYAGNAGQTIVVEAYQVNSAYPEYGEQLTAAWTASATFDSGVAKVTLDDTNKTAGSLKQGPARFVAYIDVDGDGKLSDADTYGSTETTIGYLGCDISIALGEANAAAYPMITLAGGSNTVSTIALVRSAINGKYLYNEAVGAFIVQFPNNAGREALCPEDYVMSGHVGIDKTLSKLDNVGEIESVTYEVLRLTPDQVSTLSISNLNHYVMITNGVSNVVNQAVNEEVTIDYSLTRDIVKTIAVAGNKADDIKLSFTVPTDTANSRFWLMVTNETTGAASIYGGDNGFVLNGMRDGVVVLDSEWLADNLVSVTQGKVSFAVVLGNDKFGRPGSFSDAPEATTFVNAARVYDGEIAVDVKSALPGVVFAGGITVAAYDKADLANPVAFTNGNATGVVTLKGLRAGVDYYVAAWYVKDSEDGREDDSERRPYDTWGYLCNLSVPNETGIAVSPAFDALAVEAKTAATVTNLLFLQDTDWNDNGVIDREEEFSSVNGTYFPSVSPVYGLSINGLKSELFSDADEGDVMAYALVSYQCVATTNNLGEAVWYAITDLAAETATDKTSGGIRKGTLLSDLTTLYTTYWYDEGKGEANELALGRPVTVTGDAKVMQVATKELVLVHAQVYTKFGFNPNTANGTIAKSAWVNTKAFDSTDKAYVVNYLKYVVGIADAEKYSLIDDKNNTYPDGDFVVGGRGDGIIDGWELYVMFGPAGISTTGITHSPWNFADRAFDADGDGLDLLHEYDGGVAPTDPWNGDTLGNGIGDKAVFDYDLKGADSMRKDGDNDQLSNLMEFMISSSDGFPTLDAKRMMTDGEEAGGTQLVPDYFLRHGSLYLGEMFTDHDFIEDAWEDLQGASYSRYSYDAAGDFDGDGWDNWNEARAAIAAGYEDIVTVTTNGETIVTTTTKTSLYTGAPTPKGKIRIVYNGAQTLASNVYVKAYRYVNGKPSDLNCQPDAYWTLAVKGKDAVYELGEPDFGAIAGGKSTLVVFTDAASTATDTAGTSETTSTVPQWSVGAPYGVVPEVVAAYATISPSEVELTDVSESVMRIDVVAAAAANDYESQIPLNDRGVNGSAEFANQNVQVSNFSNYFEKSSKVRVRVLRTAMNNNTSYYSSQSKVTYYVGDTVLDTVIDMNRNPVLTEALLHKAGCLDLDWLADDDANNFTYVAKMNNMNGTVQSATYTILIGDEPSEYKPKSDGVITPGAAVSAINVLSTLFVNRFEYGLDGSQTKTVPTGLAVTESKNRPTFTWTHVNSINKAYPAFRLRVWDTASNGNVVWDSGNLRAPVRAINGTYRYEAPIYVGAELESGKTYYYSVSMLDAKFRTPNADETRYAFSMNCGGEVAGTSDYATIPVAVKYFGPGLTSAKIRVEAYTSPDFGGEPASVGYVRHVDTLAATDKVEINAQLVGLHADGVYYIRAFLDTDADGVRDDWESWGYGNYVGTDEEYVYTPRAYSLREFYTSGKVPTAVVYIEDADTNNNKLPDVWEWNKDGKLGGASTTSVSAASPYVVTIDASGAIATNLLCLVEQGAVELPYYSALTKFVNGGSLSSISLALAMAGIDLDDIVVKPTVTISSFSLDSGVTLAVDAKATIDGDTLVPKAIKVEADLTVILEHAAALDGGWATVATATAHLELGGTSSVSSDELKDPSQGNKTFHQIIDEAVAADPNGFFRVKVGVVVP